jgi:hypothetical protein
MRIKDFLTYDFTASEQFKALAPVLNVLSGMVFLSLGIQGIATQHVRFKGYDYVGFDARLFGLGFCGLAAAWLLYTTFGALLVRYSWCRAAAVMLGLTFAVCAAVALARNI